MPDPAPTASTASAGPHISTSPPNGDNGGVADHIESAAPPVPAPGLCPYYHEAVELIGKRWTGAIVHTLLTGPLRFSELAHAIPQISDRLLSMRLKELEASGLVARRVWDEAPVRRVEISKAFKMSATEVTNAQFATFVKDMPVVNARTFRIILSSPTGLVPVAAV